MGQLHPDELLGLTVSQFVAHTAAAEAIPGGGSVAGVTGALGAALVEMALGFTKTKKAFAQHADDYDAIGRRLANAREMFAQLLADDASAYGLYQQAMAQEGPDKDAAVQLTLAAAIDVPREMTALSLAVLAEAALLAPRCNKWLVSDLLAGAHLLATTVRLCDFNVRINARSYADTDAAEQVRQVAEEVRQASARDVGRAETLRNEIEELAGKDL